MVLASSYSTSYEPDMVSLFVQAANQFNKASLPAFERQSYRDRYKRAAWSFYSSLSNITPRAAGCSSARSYRQIHALDSWQPTSHPMLAPFDYRFTNPELLQEFDQAQAKDDATLLCPSADLTDLQCLIGQNLTPQGIIEFPVVTIYPGRRTKINPEGLGHFFNQAIGYYTSVSIVDFRHAISQHKTQNLVSDWMTGFKKREIFVIHPLGTQLAPKFSDYEPLFNANGQPVETFNRVGHYITYEKPWIEDWLTRRDATVFSSATS